MIPNEPEPLLRWCAVYCQHRHDRTVAERLTGDGFQTHLAEYWPRLSWVPDEQRPEPRGWAGLSEEERPRLSSPPEGSKAVAHA